MKCKYCGSEFYDFEKFTNKKGKVSWRPNCLKCKEDRLNRKYKYIYNNNLSRYTGKSTKYGKIMKEQKINEIYTQNIKKYN